MPKVEVPKTTSTDIEEVTGKFMTMTSDYYASHPEETWVMDYTTKVIDFFAPHLSNKSELKKEIKKKIDAELSGWEAEDIVFIKELIDNA